MELVHRSPESSTVSAAGITSMDQIPIQETDLCKDVEIQRHEYHAVDFESDYDQVQERWHRDPFGRDNKQSVTKAVADQRTLEEAMYNEGFSQARASKIAYYLTRCEGQFQKWDFIVKKQPRLKNRIVQEEGTLESTNETVQNQHDRARDEDAEEDENDYGVLDRDRSEVTSIFGRGREQLRELKATVTGRVKSTTEARLPRSQRDERQRRRDRKAEALRIKEYASYTYDDYVQAARRYDIVYGSAEQLYQLAEERKAARLLQAQQKKNQPTTEMRIDGHLVDVEDPTFGLTQPSADQTLGQDERKTRDLQNKQLWTETQNKILIRSLERQEILQSSSMF